MRNLIIGALLAAGFGVFGLGVEAQAGEAPVGEFTPYVKSQTDIQVLNNNLPDTLRQTIRVGAQFDNGFSVEAGGGLIHAADETEGLIVAGFGYEATLSDNFVIDLQLDGNFIPAANDLFMLEGKAEVKYLFN